MTMDWYGAFASGLMELNTPPNPSSGPPPAVDAQSIEGGLVRWKATLYGRTVEYITADLNLKPIGRQVMNEAFEGVALLENGTLNPLAVNIWYHRVETSREETTDAEAPRTDDAA